MTRSERAQAARRLRMAADLFEAGVALRRQQLRREHPDLPPPQIEALVVLWLRERPGAEHGDVVGRPLPWPLQRPRR